MPGNKKLQMNRQYASKLSGLGKGGFDFQNYTFLLCLNILQGMCYFQNQRESEIIIQNLIPCAGQAVVEGHGTCLSCSTPWLSPNLDSGGNSLFMLLKMEFADPSRNLGNAPTSLPWGLLLPPDEESCCPLKAAVGGNQLSRSYGTDFSGQRWSEAGCCHGPPSAKEKSCLWPQVV